MAFNPKEHFMQLKGKDYLQVAWRLVWFREEHPDWSIETELIEHDKDAKWALFRCTISEPMTEHILATGHGSESARDFGDYLEKSETKAIGRALAILGYGTQFAPEMDEEERIVDAPVETRKSIICECCGNQIRGVGRHSATDIASMTKEKYGKQLCISCGKKLKEENNSVE